MQLTLSPKYWSATFASVAIALAVGAAQAAPVTISNPSTSVTVYGGEADNGLVPLGGYFEYTDLTIPTMPTWSIDPVLRFPDGTTVVLSNGAAGGFGSPTDLGGGLVGSSVVTGGVTVTAVTELVGTIARTRFTFTAAPGAALTGTTFLFYAENDIFGFGDDTAAFTGSIAGGDLALFQYDTIAGSTTVRLSGAAEPGSALVAFGSGIWPAWGSALETGDFSLNPAVTPSPAAPEGAAASR